VPFKKKIVFASVLLCPLSFPSLITGLHHFTFKGHVRISGGAKKKKSKIEKEKRINQHPSYCTKIPS
jgi:hypothetical protein